MRHTFGAPALAVMCCALASTTALAQEGITQAKIDEGATLFTGAGICIACHGPEGKGVPNLGADLTDDEWLHSDGSYAAILETLKEGVTADESSTGTVMPPKGGSGLSDVQLEAVAAYVWSLTHEP